MNGDERDVLRGMVANLVQIARRYGADEGELADLLGASDPTNMLTDKGVMAELDRLIESVRDLEPVMVSYEWVAQRFAMTTQGVSWLCKSGRLHSVKIRHEGRRRAAIPLWSVCQYFGPSRARRDEITAHLPRNADGEIEPVFFENVEKEENHPMTFRLCGDEPEALRSRITRLADDLAEQTGLQSMEDRFLGGRMLDRPGMIAERVGIWTPRDESGWRLRVNLWPASTAKQADRFREEKVVNWTSFLSLNEQGWEVEPNLNFSSVMGRKWFWAATTCDVRTYVNYFFSGRPYGQYRFEIPYLGSRLLLPLIEPWERQGILGPKDPDEIERKRRGRTVININPEFSVYRDWEPDCVIKLEERGRLEVDIIKALAIPLATWGEQLQLASRSTAA